MRKKRRLRPAAFLSSFSIRFIYSLEKVKIFAQKLSNLGPMLNKLMQFKRITEEPVGHSLQLLSDFAAKIATLTPF